MEPEGSLPHSQKLSISPYPDLDQSDQCPYPISKRFILILFTNLLLGFPNGLFPFGFPTNNLYAFLNNRQSVGVFPFSGIKSRVVRM
jgi:hypothetical protein